MNRHLIDELTFDISFDESEALLQETGYLQELMTGAVLPLVDAVLDEFDEPDMILALELLELNLPDLPADNLVEALLGNLRKELCEALHGLKWKAHYHSTMTSRTQSVLRQLQEFLQGGVMPWHTGTAEDRVHIQLLQELMATAPQALLSWLRSVAGDATVLRRLVQQFPPQQILDIVAGLTALSNDAIEQAVVHMLLHGHQSNRSHRQRQESRLPAAGASDDVAQFWLALLELAVNIDPGSIDALELQQRLKKKWPGSFDATAVQQSAGSPGRDLSALIADRLADPVAPSQSELIALLQRLLISKAEIDDDRHHAKIMLTAIQQAAVDAVNPVHFLRQVLQQLVADEVIDLEALSEASAIEQAAQENSLQPQIDHLQDAPAGVELIGAMLFEAAECSAVQWKFLLQAYPQEFRKALRNHVDPDHALTAIVARLPDRLLCDLFNVLAPQLASALRMPPDPVPQQQSASAADDFWMQHKPHLWRVALSCLINVDDAADPEAFLAVLSDGLDAADSHTMPVPVDPSAAEPEIPLQFRRRMLHRLLAGDAVSPVESPDRNVAEHVIQLRHPEQDGVTVELIRRILFGATECSDTQWTALLQAHPQLFRAVLSDYSDLDRAMATIVTGFPDRMLCELFDALAPQIVPVLRLPLDRAALFQSTLIVGGSWVRWKQCMWQAALSILAEADGALHLDVFVETLFGRLATASAHADDGLLQIWMIAARSADYADVLNPVLQKLFSQRGQHAAPRKNIIGQIDAPHGDSIHAIGPDTSAIDKAAATDAATTDAPAADAPAADAATTDAATTDAATTDAATTDAATTDAATTGAATTGAATADAATTDAATTDAATTDAATTDAATSDAATTDAATTDAATTEAATTDAAATHSITDNVQTSTRHAHSDPVRLLQRLIKMELPLASVTLSLAQWRILTGAAIALDPQIAPPHRTILHNSIAQYAVEAADPIGLYRDIVKALLARRSIDLDTLRQNDRHRIENQSPAAEQPRVWQAAAATLTRYLQSDFVADAVTARHAAESTELLIGQAPWLLKPILQHAVFAQHSVLDKCLRWPEPLLSRLLLLLLPQMQAVIEDVTDTVCQAYHHVVPDTPGATLQQKKWRFVGTLLVARLAGLDRRQLLDQFVAYLLTDSAATAMSSDQALEEIRTKVSTRAARCLDLDDARASNRAVAAEATSPAPPAALPQRRAQPAVGRPAHQVQRSTGKAGNNTRSDATPTQLFLGNAGMVLAAPYLPRLFAMLNLTEDTQFVDIDAAQRAVHLLQFMVNGKTATPEYQLTLNKLLCGLVPAEPVTAGIDISERERDTVEGLLTALVQNWATIGNTSIAGLRETFLQRPGVMDLVDDAWQLRVQPGVFDMLLDRLPWSFSVIRYPWMERPVHVTWRSTQ